MSINPVANRDCNGAGDDDGKEDNCAADAVFALVFFLVAWTGARFPAVQILPAGTGGERDTSVACWFPVFDGVWVLFAVFDCVWFSETRDQSTASISLTFIVVVTKPLA